jgi:hypothetical protein
MIRWPLVAPVRGPSADLDDIDHLAGLELPLHRREHAAATRQVMSAASISKVCLRTYSCA